MSQIEVNTEMLENLKLSKSAKEVIKSILEGEKKYGELWFGSESGRNKAYEELKRKLPEGLYVIKQKKVWDEKENREYFVISISARRSTKSEVPVIKTQEVSKPEYKESEEYKKLARRFGSTIARAIVKCSEQYHIDPFVLASIMVAENSAKGSKEEIEIIGRRLKKNPNYYNERTAGEGEKASRGLMQITEPTYETIKMLLGDKKTSYKDVINNPELSIKYAAKYVSYLMKIGKKSIEEIAAAYNAGPNSKYIPKEYIEKVKNAYKILTQ